VPEEIVVKMFEAAGLRIGGSSVEFFPGTRFDVMADALAIEEAAGGDEGFGVEAQVIEMVDPSGVLAEDGEMDRGCRLGARAQESGKAFD
jgi:hypothetical protein